MGVNFTNSYSLLYQVQCTVIQDLIMFLLVSICFTWSKKDLYQFQRHNDNRTLQYGMNRDLVLSRARFEYEDSMSDDIASGLGVWSKNFTKVEAPPAYVIGIVTSSPSKLISSSSIPACLPSTSTPWTRNSSQHPSKNFTFSLLIFRLLNFCHLSVTT